MTKEDWELTYYQELSEDVRHFRTMLWEAPVAIFLVDSLLLSLVVDAKSYPSLQRTLVGFGLVFTMILTYSLFKATKRSWGRIEELKVIESKGGWSRYGKEEPWYLRFPLGHPMIMLLVAFIIFLIILLIYPQFLVQAVTIDT
jgi:hypothetical protein